LVNLEGAIITHRLWQGTRNLGKLLLHTATVHGDCTRQSESDEEFNNVVMPKISDTMETIERRSRKKKQINRN
jgi:hypothetical protein